MLFLMLFLTPAVAYSYDTATLISQMEARYGLPRGLLYRVIKKESKLNPKAENPGMKPTWRKSYGLGQLTASSAMFHCKLTRKEIFDPEKNLNCSAKILAEKIKRYETVEWAVAAYNSGAPCFCKGGKYQYPSGRRCLSGSCSVDGQLWNHKYVEDILQ